MKKIPMQHKTIDVLEWFSKEGDSVYQNWELPSGEVIKRLTPYDKSPVVYWKPKESHDQR